ncbi:hypothetical protein [Gordonia terrae]
MTHTHTHTEALILAALDETQPGEFIAWAHIRDDLPSIRCCRCAPSLGSWIAATSRS